MDSYNTPAGKFSSDAKKLTTASLEIAGAAGVPLTTLHYIPALFGGGIIGEDGLLVADAFAHVVQKSLLQNHVDNGVDAEFIFERIVEALKKSTPDDAVPGRVALSEEMKAFSTEELQPLPHVTAWEMVTRAVGTQGTLVNGIIGPFINLEVFNAKANDFRVQAGVHAGGPQGAGHANGPYDFSAEQSMPSSVRQQAEGVRNARKQNAAVERYTDDLTAKAEAGKLSPVYGRDSEIEQISNTLARKNKRNPIILGEAGVGKTSIVEGLAQRIISGDVPHQIAGKKLLSVDMGGMVAGAKYRGEFEDRLRSVVNAATEDENTILFIDEIHAIAGMGAGESGTDAASLLKPLLTRGNLQIIGATTYSDYQKTFSRDAALARRFTKVNVDAPDAEASIEILKMLSVGLAEHHCVSYTDEAINAAVLLSERYIADRQLPDKAVDILDIAGARNSTELVVADDMSVSELNAAKLSAVEEGNYELAAELRDRENALREHGIITPVSIDADLVAEVVADMTGIPVGRLSEGENDRLAKMEAHIGKRVIGQQNAVSAVSRAIRRSRAGISSGQRPAGSFLFLGTTGVGKTELAKALAEFLFNDESALVRFDMSEYMEEHTVARLIGAPPGYKGHEDGGQLTNAVQKKPFSVLLFDEVEKAHPDVFNVLLQVLDDGRLTDAHGTTVDFTNTVIVMTSNLGTANLRKPQVGFGAVTSNGYEELQGRAMDAAKRHFRPEFINRVDEFIVFSELTRDNMREMVSLMTASLVANLQVTGRDLLLDEQAIDWLAQAGYDPDFGARPLRRVIQRHLEDAIADLIFAGTLPEGAGVAVTAVDGQLTVNPAAS